MYQCISMLLRGGMLLLLLMWRRGAWRLLKWTNSMMRLYTVLLVVETEKKGQVLVIENLFSGLSIGYSAAAKSLQSCPTLQPHRWQPTRLPCPWDSPGNNTGVGCHFLLQCMKVKVKSLSCVWLFTTSWTAVYQAPPSMGFSRQEYWSGLLLPSPKGKIKEWG